jgi:hypothetical protein
MSGVWPNRNTAFIVIHGSGAHRPFQTLDKFVRGFVRVLACSNPDLRRCWQHELWQPAGQIEHYISLAPDEKPVLDFYEYYWDFHVQRRVNLPEVTAWLHQVSDSATQFYRIRPELSKSHEARGSTLFKDGEFKVGGYFISMGWIGHVLRWMQPVGSARVPILSPIATLLLSWSSGYMAQVMGDVIVYTAADVRSRNYAIRQEVLEGAVAALKRLLARDEYDRVVVVGHSLGSLIAYDAINQIVLEMNSGNDIAPEHARKLVGLVTFGSPLDKVAFFFREFTPKEEYVRRQILSQSACFRSRPLVPGEAEDVTIGNPIQRHLPQVRWLNFYHLHDPVSGHLDAYSVDRNIECTAPVRGTAEAHNVYWTDEHFYTELVDAFFQNRLDAFLKQP